MFISVGGNNKMLDIAHLELDKQYEKVGYLYNFRESTSVTQKGFFTMYLKDVNGKVIVGRLFNVDNFKDSGLTMQALKGKPVKVNFHVQEFNGSLSLIINTVSVYTGDFDYGSFIGKVEGVEDFFAYTQDVLCKLSDRDIKLPSIYRTKSLRRIYDGRAGGYTKLLQMVVSNVISYDSIIGLDRQEIANTIAYLQEIYFRYLEQIEDIDFITKSMKMKILYDAQIKMEKVDVGSYVIDALTALLDLGKPESLAGLLVYRMFESNTEILNFACQYDKMLVGVTRQVGDGTLLLKY